MPHIDTILSRMTVREKVGQCIQIELDKIDFRSPDATAEWFARYPAGSIVKGPDVAGVANGGRPVNDDAVERLPGERSLSERDSDGPHGCLSRRHKGRGQRQGQSSGRLRRKGEH